MRLCLVGAHVEGSPSAVMYQAALTACGIDGTYERRSVQPSQLDEFILELRQGGYGGCNVTMPYKRVLALACDELHAEASTLGVVNTVTPEGSALHGSNTDVAGFERGLRGTGMWPQQGARAVVLGAGGAAAAVCLALTRAELGELHLVARRLDQAEEIAQRLREQATIMPRHWQRDELAPLIRRADIVVNTTPAGLDAMPFDVHELAASCTVADVRYRPRPVDLVSAAAEAGLRAQDGLEMLLQQALLSFQTWTGMHAPEDVMRSALHGALAA